MRADEMLVAHHDVLRRLIGELLNSGGGQAERRSRLRAELAAEASLHEQIEDEIFYPATRHLSALVPIAHAEHRQMDDQLTTLLRVSPSTDRFAAELAVFVAALEHHAGKEETEMFPEVVRKLDDAALDDLGERLQARLAHLRGSPVTRLRLRVKRETLRLLYDYPLTLVPARTGGKASETAC